MQSNIMNVNDLRNMLAEELTKLRNEQTTPASLNAIVNATGKILSTVKLEMEYGKMLGVTPRIDFIKITKLEKPEKEAVRQIK